MNELERAGREMLILETLAEMARFRDEIDHYRSRYGSFEALESAYHAASNENFDLDDTYLTWKWAREHLQCLEKRLESLNTHAA